MGIHIKQAQFESIVDMFVKAKEDTEIEIRFNFVDNAYAIDTTQFKRLLRYISQWSQVICGHHITFDESSYKYTLDVMPPENARSKLRYTLEGLDTISKYCMNPSSDFNVEAIEKSSRGHIDINEHDLRVASSQERKVDRIVASNGFIEMQDAPKTFRLKKRLSVKIEDFQLDLTVVKQLPPKQKTNGRPVNPSMHMFGTVLPTYEVELEYKGEKPLDKPAAEAVVKRLLKLSAEFLKALQDIDYLIPNSKIIEIIRQYHGLAFPDNNKRINFAYAAKKTPRMLFAGPQPVSLELHNLVADHKTENILHNYTVTHKADGKRSLVYVDKTGDVYLIDGGMKVRMTKVKAERACNSLFDAEVIDKSDAKLILIFDAYYYSRTDVRKKFLEDHAYSRQLFDRPKVVEERTALTTRMDYVRKFIREIDVKDKKYAFEFKRFVVTDTKMPDGTLNLRQLRETCRRMLEYQQLHREFDFHTDGLIFTPNEYPVGATSAKGAPVLGETWPSTFKWKPPAQNTIDFYVEYSTTGNPKFNVHDIIIDDLDTNIKYKRLNLFVVERNLPDTPLEMITYMHDLYERQKAEKNGKKMPFVSRDCFVQFSPPFDRQETSSSPSVCDVEVTETTPFGICSDETHDVIDDKSIVEMSWDREHNKWIPLRVRHDKTDILRSSGLVSSTANVMATALNVWRSINNPVTPQHLVDMRVSEKEIAYYKDVYFAGDKERFQKLMKHMIEFHNRWVKERIIVGTLAKDDVSSVFDIACGRGADIFRWADIGVTTMLGIDSILDNIMNKQNGTYARMAGKTYNRNADRNYDWRRYVFIPLSGSQKINKAALQSIQLESTKKLALTLWGHEKPTEETRHLANMANDKFDVVSCQFAVHYFFENDSTLDALCFNISNHLNKGGYFVGTCFNGERVNNLLGNRAKVSGDVDDKQIWMIQKGYETYEPNTTGQKISVYTESINQTLDEYLVDKDLLDAKLAVHGIFPLNKKEMAKLDLETSWGTFEDAFRDLQKHIRDQTDIPELDQRSYNLMMNMTDAEKEFSFLNMWFIYIKREK